MVHFLVSVMLLNSAVANDSQKAARSLDSVQVSATRVREAAFAIPNAITVIDREALKRDRAATPVDYLHRVPGVFVQHTTPGQGTPIVRGLKGSEVLHMVDGFRLNNTFFRNAPSQYFSLVDAQNIDQIEVLRGPASTLYGSDAMGGVVQVLTPESDYVDSGDARFGGLTRSIYSTAELQRTSHLRGSAAGTSAVLDAGLTYNQFGSLDVGEGGRLPFSNYESYGGNVKLRWQPVDGHELMFSYQDHKQPQTPRNDALLRGFGARPENSEFFFEPNRRRFAHLRYRALEPSLGLEALEVHLGRQVVDDDRVTREFGAFNRDFEQNRSSMDGLTAQASKSIGGHFLTLGADLYFDRVDSARQRIDIRNGARSTPTARFPNDSFQRSLGVFVTDDWAISDQLDIVSGLRWSNQSTRLKPADRGIGVDVAFDDISGQLGVRYSLSETWQLVGNLGRGFRAPNIFDLGTFGVRPGNRFNQPNPNLGPETLLGFDLGFKHESQSLSLEAFVFASDYNDKIVSVLTGQVISGRQVVESRNVSRVRLKGAELGLRFRPSSTVEAWLTATYVRANERQDGVETPGDRIPPLAGSAGARWVFSRALSLEGYTLFAANQDRLSLRDATDPRINPNGTPGHSTANLALAYESGPWFARLAYENLFDFSYRNHGSGIDAPGANFILSIERELSF